MAIEILIVDDNSDIRNILNELILDAGYKTRVAANYNQALTEIDKKMPDVAILDVKLDKGDNDGIELLSHIKSKNKDVPVIIITGHANIEMAVNSLKHGAFEFVEKPFDQTRLLNFVSRAVENLELKNQNKVYVGTITLGGITASYDLETPVNNNFKTEHLNEDLIIAKSKKFVGIVEQKPPVFSALKKNGERLYVKARKGEKVNIKKRKVFIKSFEITAIINTTKINVIAISIIKNKRKTTQKKRTKVLIFSGK